LYSPPPMFRCAIQIHSAVHCNAKFSTGRSPAIRHRSDHSPARRSTTVKLLRAYCKQCARPAMLMTIGRIGCADQRIINGLGMSVSLPLFVQ
jgi:hypothetical protein